MTNNQLTDDRIAALLDCVEMCEDMSVDENAEMATALRELQERRKADSEPVAWDYEWASCITCEGPQNFNRVIEREAPPEWAVEEGQARNIIPLYRHAQPAKGLELAGWQFKSVNGDWLGLIDEHGKNQAVREGCEVREVFAMADGVNDRDQVRREHAEWSQTTFGNVGPIGPLKHLSKEALEAAAEPGDLSEWADMQFLMWDAQRRAGITDEQITQAMVEKLAVNKQREWPEPKDGEPRLHIKEQPAAVGPVTDAMAYAFHHALTDGPLGDDDVEDIKTGLRAAFANVTTYQPLPVVLKEHQIRELVNKLRDIAIEYHGTQQLREHIACVIRTAISAVAPPAPKSAVN